MYLVHVIGMQMEKIDAGVGSSEFSRVLVVSVPHVNEDFVEVNCLPHTDPLGVWQSCREGDVSVTAWCSGVSWVILDFR